MRFPLLPLEIDVLIALNEEYGRETRMVSKYVRVYGKSERSKSMTVRGILLRLRNSGMVDCLDDEKPALWVRTPRGTNCLANHGYLEGFR